MAVEDIVPGYMGFAQIGESGLIRCNGFTFNPVQTPLFYNHVFGLNDDGDSSETKGERIGEPNEQRIIWRPSPISITGGLSFPADEQTGAPAFSEAASGDYIDAVTIDYSCEIGRTFTDCRVNTYNISVTAGEMVNIQVDFLAMGVSDGGNGGTFREARKLITWDTVKVEVSGINALIQGFNLSVNNNAKYVYTNNGDSLFPYDIRLGMQEVTGNILVYKLDDVSFMDEAEKNTILFSYPGFSTTINCVFGPSTAVGSIGPFFSTIPFHGVDMAIT